MPALTKSRLGSSTSSGADGHRGVSALLEVRDEPSPDLGGLHQSSTFPVVISGVSPGVCLFIRHQRQPGPQVGFLRGLAGGHLVAQDPGAGHPARAGGRGSRRRSATPPYAVPGPCCRRRPPSRPGTTVPASSPPQATSRARAVWIVTGPSLVRRCRTRRRASRTSARRTRRERRRATWASAAARSSVSGVQRASYAVGERDSLHGQVDGAVPHRGDALVTGERADDPRPRGLRPAAAAAAARTVRRPRARAGGPHRRPSSSPTTSESVVMTYCSGRPRSEPPTRPAPRRPRAPPRGPRAGRSAAATGPAAARRPEHGRRSGRPDGAAHVGRPPRAGRARSDRESRRPSARARRADP